MKKWNAARAPAGRIAYVNGRYLPHGEAGVHIEDRGLQLADSVYEVCNVRDGRMLDLEEHLDRLERSLGIVEMAMPMARAALKLVMAETIRRNRVRNGLLYLQVTRGAVRRDHAIPDDGPRPTLILTARSVAPEAAARKFENGIAAITRPDERWARCDIKTTQLLPNLLARTAAKRAGAGEALLVDRDGFITEGAGANVWIVDRDGNVVTRNLGNDILPGVTRRVVMEAVGDGLSIAERKFTLAEAMRAREVFLTSANGAAVPIVAIDGKPVGDGKPGPVGRRIRALYLSRAEGKAR